ncbi:hypothetical protein VTP01DRAFT_8869 [Rhizomucor pusillus]|uniref:uncharacterized protein n=1 Tax=Rhizomucor pusillus TaxID=4840 RepID=UPI003744648E
MLDFSLVVLLLGSANSNMHSKDDDRGGLTNQTTLSPLQPHAHRFIAVGVVESHGSGTANAHRNRSPHFLQRPLAMLVLIALLTMV